jgi:hypothetical protein
LVAINSSSLGKQNSLAIAYAASNPSIARRVNATKAKVAIKKPIVTMAVEGRRSKGINGLSAAINVPKMKVMR